ncbi:MAG: Sugar efflux transporter A [Candidatus Celerinatantimonas neptuna]|nr:MAG: Sugar efflux transporter A [Candidatus Celerinatantimonas neptuna]
MFNGQAKIYFIINGLAAAAYALILPIMSLYLVDELHTPPALIGVYTTATALSSAWVSHRLTSLLDSGFSSKILLLFAITGIFLASLGYAFAQQFWQALIVGVFFMSFGYSAIPLILAMIRCYAEKTGQDSAKLNSQMRSSVSLLWIVGPPLAFLSVAKLGFRHNFYLASLIAIVVLISVTLLLDSESVTCRKDVTLNCKINQKLPKQVWFLGLVIFFANVANSTFLNAMPLYLTQQLRFAKSTPGFLIGLTSLLEIPVMFFSVRWAQRIGKIKVLLFGFMAALIFYIGLQMADHLYEFFILQLVDGLFFGIFVGLGVTLLQDYAPLQVGKASAFYANAMLIGTMVGTSVMGVLAQYFGYQKSLLLSFVSMLIAVALLMHFENNRQAHLAMNQMDSSDHEDKLSSSVSYSKEG